MSRTIADLRADAAADNTAVLALARGLDPLAVLVKGMRRGEFDPLQPRDEHGRFVSVGGRRKDKKRRGRGPIRTFGVNAGREAGKIVGRHAGRAMVAAGPVLAALAANELHRRMENHQARAAWEREGPVTDGEKVGERTYGGRRYSGSTRRERPLSRPLRELSRPLRELARRRRDSSG